MSILPHSCVSDLGIIAAFEVANGSQVSMFYSFMHIGFGAK